MPLAPRLAPLADNLDLFMTLNREPIRIARGMEHRALVGLWPDLASVRLRSSSGWA